MSARSFRANGSGKSGWVSSVGVPCYRAGDRPHLCCHWWCVAAARANPGDFAWRGPRSVLGRHLDGGAWGSGPCTLMACDLPLARNDRFFAGVLPGVAAVLTRTLLSRGATDSPAGRRHRGALGAVTSARGAAARSNRKEHRRRAAGSVRRRHLIALRHAPWGTRPADARTACPVTRKDIAMAADNRGFFMTSAAGNPRDGASVVCSVARDGV